jgi:hypothetical protein
MAQKLRFSLSGLSGLLVYLVIFAVAAFFLQHYFPGVDDHVGAVISQIISLPLGVLFAVGIYKPVMLRLFPDGDSSRK